jgi:hypothetical protein
VFPEGVAGGMLEEFLGLNRVGFFLRPVARDVIQKLKDLHQSGFQQQTTPIILGKEQRSSSESETRFLTTLLLPQTA